MKNWKSQFRNWLKEIVPYERIEPYVQFKVHYPPESWELDEQEIRIDPRQYDTNVPDRDILRVRVYTKSYLYSIVAHENYLGCVSSCRKSRAGEDWTRGHDLPDGRFCQDTWDNIKNAIIGNELVKVVRFQRPQQEVAIPTEERTR